MIMILSQFTRLVSTPPGDLVYHLVVLFAIEAILMMAIGEGRRANWQGNALRVVLAAGGLLLARGVLVGVALLAAVGATKFVLIAPPMERFVAVASLGLLAWAFLPLLEDYPQAGLVLVVVNLVGGLILYAISAQQWQAEQATGAFYNATPADWVWNVWAAALALLALVAAMIRRRAQSGLLVAAFGVLLWGHVLHLGMAEAQSHVAGWVRLAELCAYPVLAGLMMRRAAEREEPALPSGPGQPAGTPWIVIETCQRVADAASVKVALQRAGAAISNVLNADVLAIGVLDKTGHAVELSAVCRTGEPARSGPSFDLDSQAPVQLAVTRQRAVMVDADQDEQRATLAALVGGAAGPLWVQPLIHQHVAMGVLIVGRPHKPGWTTGETQTLNGLCGVLAAALSAGHKAATLTRQVDELTQLARDREKALLQAQAEAQSSKEEVRRLGALASAQAGRPRSADPVVLQREAMRAGPTPPARQPPVAEPGGPEPLAARKQFFDQATRHLERLDEARGRLAISPGDQGALSEFVRASGAIKETATTMGYPTLAKLAGTLVGALERLFDRRQPITSEELALVGEGAQALRALLADAEADRSPGLDTTSLLGRLAVCAGAMPPGMQTLQARISLNRDTPLRTARAMMVLMQIKRVGQIVACQPVEADIRSGGFEEQFSVTFSTSSKPDAVRAALAAIPDVTGVVVSPA